MKISYNCLKEYIDLKEKPQKIADILTMHSYEVESVEKIGKDYILDIDILPNRSSDSLSHIGVARELASLLNKKIKFKYPKIKEDKKTDIKDYLSVDIKEKSICKRYTARVILDVRVKDSPRWLKERLEALGQNTINNIVDATNYAMFLLGQPIHAFDLDKIKNGKIIIKKAKDGESIETLGGDKYSLDSSVLTINSKEAILAIAGIKGGVKAELDKNTKNIILESAYFDPVQIRKASKKINLRTESSLRFENEISPFLCKNALDFVSDLILKLASGKVVCGVIDSLNLKYRPIKIPFKISELKSILGVDIKDKEVLSLLKKLNFTLKKAKKQGVFIAEVPSERLDIKIKEDLAEELARIYGYENIKSKPITDKLWPAKRNDDYFYSEKARDLLLGLGLSDAYNYSFVGKKELNLWDENYVAIKLLNPLSEDKKYLRPSLLLHLLNNVFENLKYQKSIRLFELGKVFNFTEKSEPGESKKLAGIISCKKQDNGIKEFYELKGILESFLLSFGFDDFSFLDIKDKKRAKFWHKGRSAEVFLDGKKIGLIGEISHFILEKVNIKSRVAAFELDFDFIVAHADEDLRYKAISKFPSSSRDLAVLVDIDTRVDEVQAIIENSAGPLLVDVDLFDIYEGEDFEEGLKKSFAFHLIFQSNNKTLSDEELDEKIKKILLAIAKNGWEIRL